MNKRFSACLGLVLAAASVSAVWAAKVGDPAAPLKVKDWIKGKAVDVKDGKNYYVIEFWTTWSESSRASIAHLSELQKKLKDKGVVVVGISDETADKVKPLVEEQGGKMDYVVAVDDARATFRAYMEAFGQDVIPYTFVVGTNGQVIWHGPPKEGLDKALEEMVAGKYDLPAAVKADEPRAAKAEFRAALEEYRRLSRAGDARARELGKKLLELKGKGHDGLCDFAFAIATDLQVKDRDFALAEEALNRAEKAAAAKTAKVLSVRAIVLFETGHQDEGQGLLKEAVSLAKDAQEKALLENWVQIMERRKAALSQKPAEPSKKPVSE